jgi:hypothetical protein
MYHAEAVVGVNTSGMIESGIIGRPVYAVQVEEFAATQDGTLHFQHLKNVDGGLLHLSSTLDEHIAQLERLPVDGEAGRRKAQRFIQAFVRPHGLGIAATPTVVEEIEQCLAGPRAAPTSDRATARVARVFLAPVAFALTLFATDPVKRRAIVLHWTRPARLMARAWFSRLVYAWRWLRRLPSRVVMVARLIVVRGGVRPLRLGAHAVKMRVHAWLARRKGESGQVG